MTDRPAAQVIDRDLSRRKWQPGRSDAITAFPYAWIVGDALHAAAPAGLPSPVRLTGLPEFPHPVCGRLIDGHFGVRAIGWLDIRRNGNRRPLPGQVAVDVTVVMAIPLRDLLHRYVGTGGIDRTAIGRRVDTYDPVISMKLPQEFADIIRRIGIERDSRRHGFIPEAVRGEDRPDWRLRLRRSRQHEQHHGRENGADARHCQTPRPPAARNYQFITHDAGL